MENLIRKIEKIINSKKFYEKAKYYFKKCYEEYYYKDDVKLETVKYLYYEYFNKFEKEYILLSGNKWNFIYFIFDLCEETLEKIINEFNKLN